MAAKLTPSKAPRETLRKRKTPQTKTFGAFEFGLEEFPDLFPSEYDDIIEEIEENENPELIKVVKTASTDKVVLLVGMASAIRRVLKEKVFNYIGGQDDYEIWLGGQQRLFYIDYPPSMEKRLTEGILKRYGCRNDGQGHVVGPMIGLMAWFWNEYCSGHIELYEGEKHKCMLLL